MSNPWREILSNGNNAELARKLGVKPPSVHAWKKGEAHPSPDIIRRILDTHPDVTAAHILEHYEHARAGKQPVEVPSE